MNAKSVQTGFPIVLRAISHIAICVLKIFSGLIGLLTIITKPFKCVSTDSAKTGMEFKMENIISVRNVTLEVATNANLTPQGLRLVLNVN